MFLNRVPIRLATYADTVSLSESDYFRAYGLGSTGVEEQSSGFKRSGLLKWMDCRMNCSYTWVDEETGSGYYCSILMNFSDFFVVFAEFIILIQNRLIQD